MASGTALWLASTVRTGPDGQTFMHAQHGNAPAEVWRMVHSGGGWMRGVPAQLPELVCCGVTASLTVIEAAKLRVNCRQVPAAEAVLICELVAGHDGSHVAFATTANDDELWWWLCWGAQTREVRQIELCDARWLDDPYLDDCLLPDGHLGPHSFHLQDGLGE
jgi:hypothetical protein